MAVTAAASGPAALATMRTAAIHGRSFDVAVLDRSMPGMSGLELKSAISVDPALDPRLILMTGLGLERDIDEPQESGTCHSITKPVHAEDLKTCLRSALGHSDATRVPVEMSLAPSVATGEPLVGRLLLAEDNPINQKVAVAMLSGAGYEVDTVANGADAVEAASAREYEAILMDCQMPTLNGYDATAAIRAQEGPGRHTPIIALTAGARREDRERCLAEGMDNYLAKPVSKDALLAMVARCIKLGSASVASPSAARALETILDPSVFDELHMLSDDTGHDLVGELIEQFSAGVEPMLVELRAAVEDGDALSVGRIAHVIRASSDQLGGRRFATACGRLERKATTGRLTDDVDVLGELESDHHDLCSALREHAAGLRRSPASSAG
jgi:CheY-like chemotaxis protein